MKLIFSALLLSALFANSPGAFARSVKKTERKTTVVSTQAKALTTAQNKCAPMQISGEKEKAICSLSLSVLLNRSAQGFCKKGEVCIGQMGAFNREVLGQALFVLERDLPKKGYELKLSAVQLYRMLDAHLASNSDENSVAMVSMYLAPYVVAAK